MIKYFCSDTQPVRKLVCEMTANDKLYKKNVTKENQSEKTQLLPLLNRAVKKDVC